MAHGRVVCIAATQSMGARAGASDSPSVGA